MVRNITVPVKIHTEWKLKLQEFVICLLCLLVSILQWYGCLIYILLDSWTVFITPGPKPCFIVVSNLLGAR